MRLVDEQLLTIGKEFRDKHRYLLRVSGEPHQTSRHSYSTTQLLTARTLKVSVQNELQHLVMRLNFNGFYGDGFSEVADI